jgi:hypothetical protein
MGRTKEAKASGNALDMPTLVWSEMARKRVEPSVNPEKQMSASTCWLMRPGAPAQRSGGHHGCLPVSPSRSVRFIGAGQRAGHKKISDRSYEDLSRMKGNFHVRFLGECGRGNPPALTRPLGCRVSHGKTGSRLGDPMDRVKGEAGMIASRSR